MCFGYHEYTHLFWFTDKLGIYHVYMYELCGILHAKYSYGRHIDDVITSLRRGIEMGDHLQIKGKTSLKILI